MFRIAIEELVDAIGSHEATAFGDNLTQDVRYGIVWRKGTGDEGGNNRGSRDRARDAAPNPWLANSGSEKPLDPEPPDDNATSPPASPSGPAAPQPGLPGPPPDARLPRTTLTPGATARVWWLGVHGGAGESTLEQLLDGSRAAGHAWPVPAPGTHAAARPSVVLVARTHAHGLRAAQAAARDWASGDVPVRLLGLLLIADAPGRLPRPLRDLSRLVAGGVPASWSVAWYEPWRLGTPVATAGKPGDAMAAISAIEDLTTPVPASPAQADPVGNERSPAASPPTRGIARA